MIFLSMTTSVVAAISELSVFDSHHQLAIVMDPRLPQETEVQFNRINEQFKNAGNLSRELEDGLV